MGSRLRHFILLGGLLGPLGLATAADADLVPVWKRDDGTAHIRLAAPKTLPEALVSVSYHLVAVNTALPTIVGDFGGLEHIAWVGTAYLLTSTAATPLFGKLSDLYGRRALFQAAIVIFVVGSLACGISQSLLQLVLARGLQGIGGGGLQAMGLVVIGDVVSPRERGRYTALMTGVFAIAAWLWGPAVIDFISQGRFVVEPYTAAVVVVSAGLVASMCITGPALLARAQHRWFVGGWVLAAVATIVLLALPIDSEAKATAALLVAPALGVIVHVVRVSTFAGEPVAQPD